MEGLLEKKELKQNGYSIYYYATASKASNTIVLLHAAFIDHRCFNNQIEFFSKTHKVITLDMLGHGASKINNAKDKIDCTVKHINEILKLEKVDNAHFVGVSMGSLMAQYYALHNPLKVLSLTAVGGYDINANNKEIQKAQRFESLKWLLKALWSMNQFRRYVASVSVQDPAQQALFYEMAQNFTLKSFTGMSGLNNIIKQRDNVKRNYPLLLICGENEIELAMKANNAWHNKEITSEFKIVKNAGHCANMDNPNDFNNLVIDFINSRT